MILIVTWTASICLNIFYDRVKVDGMYYVYMCHVYVILEHLNMNEDAFSPKNRKNFGSD